MSRKQVIVITLILSIFIGCGSDTSSEVDTNNQSNIPPSEQISVSETRTIVNNEAVNLPQGTNSNSVPTEQISTN